MVKRVKAGLMVLAAVVMVVGAGNLLVAASPGGDPYPLDSCPISGHKLDAMGAAVVKEFDGREVRFCCDGCVGKFKGDQKTYWKKIDAEIVKQQAKHYPIKTCLVMGEEMGGEAKPINHVYKNRLLQFCCPMCVRGFKKNPEKALKRLDEMIVKKESKSYPVKTCLVSGQPLGDGAINHIFANQLVKLCCGGCKKGFAKDPVKFMAKKQAAVKASKG